MTITLNNMHLASGKQQSMLRTKEANSNPAFTGAQKYVNEVVGQVKKFKPDGEEYFEKVVVSPKMANILSNEKLHKVLSFAQKNSAVFLAAASAAFACVLRPATIMSLPGKDIEDKTYASGHSIASGAIGLVASTMFLNPLAGGLKAIQKNPTKYLGDGAAYLGDKAKDFGSSGNFKMAQKYVSMVPSIAIGIPQAILTVALIPVVLKHVFGLEKKGAKKVAQQAQQLQAQPQIKKSMTSINFKSFQMKESQVFKTFKENALKVADASKPAETSKPVSFTGLPDNVADAAASAMKKSSIFEPVKKLYHAVYDPILDTIAKAEAAVLKSETMKKVVDISAVKVKTKEGLIKNKENDKLITHLSVAQSALISGLYMNKTLKNKKLDDQHRKTLAINQGLVFGVSTAMTYSLDKIINKKVNKLVDKFEVANPGMSKVDLKFFSSAIKTAKSLVIVGFIYRYFSPVAVTPIANWLGKKLQNNKPAEAVANQQVQQAQPVQNKNDVKKA